MENEEWTMDNAHRPERNRQKTQRRKRLSRGKPVRIGACDLGGLSVDSGRRAAQATACEAGAVHGLPPPTDGWSDRGYVMLKTMLRAFIDCQRFHWISTPLPQHRPVIVGSNWDSA